MLKIIAFLSIVFFPTTSALSTANIWAVPVPNFNIKSQYVAPVKAHGSGHRGIDFKPGQNPVTAPTAGTISFSGTVVNRSILTIKDGSGLLVSFEQLCSDLEVGAEVERGQVLGVYCSSHETFVEHCSGCIHLSVRSSQGYLNPELFFGSLQPSVLKS